MTDPRRSIPSLDRLLSSAAFAPLLADYPREMIRSMARTELDRRRAKLAAEATSDSPTDSGVSQEEALAGTVYARLAALQDDTLRHVINATGVVLHTNLGRAPLAAAAVDAMRRVAGAYTNLEYDTDAGARGSRYVHCRDLLVQLTGAEDALVVNNNAAAVVLALNTLALGKEAVISRGELVEIGGAFRVPEIMARSGAVLREVGSTNRTHPADYEAAIGEDTGVLLKVHPSNFTISGYVAQVTARELADLGRRVGVPVVYDAGSGLFVDPTLIGLSADEPTARASLDDGVAVVTMSGDKLCGGPQCGLIVGDAVHIDAMRRNPLCRALRVDKLTLAALAATLRLYLRPDQALRQIPVLRMLATTRAQIDARAAAFATECEAAGIGVERVENSSAVGGGASPGASLPTVLLLIADRTRTAAELDRRLRTGRTTVVARIVDDRVAIDLRTVEPADQAALLQALREACAPEPAPVPSTPVSAQ